MRRWCYYYVVALHFMVFMAMGVYVVVLTYVVVAVRLMLRGVHVTKP